MSTIEREDERRNLLRIWVDPTSTDSARAKAKKQLDAMEEEDAARVRDDRLARDAEEELRRLREEDEHAEKARRWHARADESRQTVAGLPEKGRRLDKALAELTPMLREFVEAWERAETINYECGLSYTRLSGVRARVSIPVRLALNPLLPQHVTAVSAFEAKERGPTFTELAKSIVEDDALRRVDPDGA